MDANNEFDKLIKEKLAKGTPQVPSQLKAAVEARLVKEGLIRKGSGSNGRWLLGSLSVIAILAILAGGYYYMNNNSETSSSKTYNSETIQSNENILTENQIVNNEEEKIALGKNTDQMKVDDNSNEKNVNGKNVNEILPVTEEKIAERISNVSNINSEIKVKEEHTTNTAVAKSKNNSNLKGVESKPKVAKPNSQKQPEDKQDLLVVNNKEDKSITDRSNDSDLRNDIELKKDVEEKPQDETDNRYSEQTSLTKSNANSDSISKSEKTILNSNLNEQTPVASDKTGSDFIANSGSEIQQNAIISPAVENAKVDSAITDSSAKTNVVIAPVDSSMKDSTISSRFSIEAFAGIQFTMKQGLDYTNSKGESLNSAKNSEVIIGLKLNYFINKFTLGAGVNYSKHTSQIPSVYNTFYMDTSSALFPISIAGTVSTDYSIIDVPILVGYNFKMNKFAVHVESGISFSFISDAKSVFALEDTNIVINNLSILTPEKSYMNYVGQVSFLYSVSRKLQFMIQPSFNYGLSGIFKELPEEKINVFSLKAGLRLNF